MNENPETTESIPDAARWLDQLSDPAALGIMAEDQAGAAAAVRASLPEIEKASRAILDRLKASSTGRIIYAGAGTSIRIGVQDGVELTPTFDWPEDRALYLIAGGPRALLRSVENAEDNAEDAQDQVRANTVGPDDVLIGIAASGSTPFTCAAVETARRLGALTIGIANNPASRLVALAEHGITLKTGAESVAGSTRLKAGTAQKICLNLISTLVMVRLGRVRNGMMSAMRASNAKLRARQIKIDAALKS
ncbi:N-acetylmuramic acid 6-phosphate etherase [Alphaproteobacteria bacterium LSUCC0684]